MAGYEYEKFDLIDHLSLLFAGTSRRNFEASEKVEIMETRMEYALYYECKATLWNLNQYEWYKEITRGPWQRFLSNKTNHMGNWHRVPSFVESQRKPNIPRRSL